jgi:hypothetical protein
VRKLPRVDFGFSDKISAKSNIICQNGIGIAWFQLLIDGRPEGRLYIPLPEQGAFLNQDLRWTTNSMSPELHVINVMAQNKAGGQTVSDPINLYVMQASATPWAALAAQLATPTVNPFAVPTPLPTPAYTPLPTFTPLGVTATPPIEIAMLDTRSEVRPDGTINTTAGLSMYSLDMGSFQLINPRTMKLGESREIRLLIAPNSALIGLPQTPIGGPLLPGGPEYALQQRNGQIRIYPSMCAQLIATNFEIDSDDQADKSITSLLPIEWVWVISPKTIGKQILILNISMPVTTGQPWVWARMQPPQNIPIEIEVEVTPTPTPTPTLRPTETPTPTPTPQPTETPTPTPTPTPLPALVRIREEFIENTPAILIAIIGVIGVLVTAFVGALATIYVARLSSKKSSAKRTTTQRKP